MIRAIKIASKKLVLDDENQKKYSVKYLNIKKINTSQYNKNVYYILVSYQKDMKKRLF